jgi:hypothetical protein
MGRHTKATVDYFPHYVHHGKTLYILEQRWGINGYAGFYKLLEILADEPGHFYDARKTDKFEFLIAKIGISGPEILQKLSDLEIIDSELWSHHIIWMESFVESVKDAYSKRSTPLPTRPPLEQFLSPKKGENGDNRDGNQADAGLDDISGVRKQQKKVKESKRKKDMPDSGLSLFDSFYQKYPVKKAKQEAIKAWNKLKPENGTVELILSAIQKQKDANEASKKKGEFVPEWPYPATWLNGKRWEDETHTTANEDKPVFGLSPDEEKFLKEQEERENG